MLGTRYKYDGVPLLYLNDLQRIIKKQIDQKVEEGTYNFEEVVCSICNGDEFEILATKDRYGLYMPVVICTRCGLIQTNPRMDQAS